VKLEYGVLLKVGERLGKRLDQELCRVEKGENLMRIKSPDELIKTRWIFLLILLVGFAMAYGNIFSK